MSLLHDLQSQTIIIDDKVCGRDYQFALILTQMFAVEGIIIDQRKKKDKNQRMHLCEQQSKSNITYS